MIDSHAHLLSDDPMRYPPSPPSGELKPGELDDPMTIGRLLGEMDKAGVDKAVLVQRGSVYGFDNSYVCDSAEAYPDRLAAVCAINGEADDAAERVRYWVKDRGAVGIRFMELVRGADIGWLDSDNSRKAWRTAHDLGVPVCVHFFPWNRRAGLTHLRSILGELPEVSVVIDHFSNMSVDDGAPDYGVDDLLAAVADFSGVNVKYTTIPLGRLAQAGTDATPIVRRVVDLFGADRVMWGSDISQSPGTYDYMADLARTSVALLDDAQKEQVLDGTTRAVYGSKWG